MVPSHLRFAAGVCVLVAGLLMGAPWAAVSFAKPPSSDSTAPSDGGTNASDQQPSTGKKTPKKTPGGTDTNKGKPDPSQQPSTGATSQTNAPGGTDATDETTDSGTGATTSGTGATTVEAAPP